MKALFILFIFSSQGISGENNLDELGRAEFAGGRFRSAKAYFEQAVRSAGDRPAELAILLSNLGQTLLELGELSNAEKVARQSLDLNPGSAPTWQLLGQVRYAKGDHSGAEQAIRKALSFAAPNSTRQASCLNDLALLTSATTNRREAAELLERVVATMTPGQAHARIISNIGIINWLIGKKKKAEMLLRQALAEMEEATGPQHPDVARILEVYSEVLAKTGRKIEAKAAAERARDLKLTFGFQTNAGSAAVDWRDLR
jgi:tetratricopeptide (TPR) repeat protein